MKLEVILKNAVVFRMWSDMAVTIQASCVPLWGGCVFLISMAKFGHTVLRLHYQCVEAES